MADDAPSQEGIVAENQEFAARRRALDAAMDVLTNARERRIFEARRLAEEPVTLDALAEEFAISRERSARAALVSDPRTSRPRLFFMARLMASSSDRSRTAEVAVPEGTLARNGSPLV